MTLNVAQLLVILVGLSMSKTADLLGYFLCNNF